MKALELLPVGFFMNLGDIPGVIDVLRKLIHDSPRCVGVRMSKQKAVTPAALAKLLRRIHSGDEAAWHELEGEFRPLVYRWTRYSGLQESDAADVVQEVLVSVVTSIKDYRYDGQVSSFRGWLWTITRNQICLHHRQLRRRTDAANGRVPAVQVHDLPNTPPPQNAGNGRPVPANFDQALDTVRKSCGQTTWQAFWRLTVTNEAAPEIGADLGMSPSAVRQAKYRILQRIRKLLLATDVDDN